MSSRVNKCEFTQLSFLNKPQKQVIKCYDTMSPLNMILRKPYAKIHILGFIFFGMSTVNINGCLGLSVRMGITYKWDQGNLYNDEHALKLSCGIVVRHYGLFRALVPL